MGKKRWTDETQFEWFEAKKVEFLQQQENHTLETWWGPIYQEWFDTWPLGEPSAEEMLAAEGNKKAAKALQLEIAKDVSKSCAPIVYGLNSSTVACLSLVL